MRDSVKRGIAAACVAVVWIGGSIAVGLEQNRKQEREQFRQALAVELLHQSYLPDLYNQINHESFGGRLPADVSVSWADLSGNTYCGGCGGITDYDSGLPAIRINTATVKTEKGLRELMQHEMCHVAVYEAGQKDENNPHGRPWQECMKRFD